MDKIADFRIQINKIEDQFKLILSNAEDEFEMELEDPRDLVDEVEELVQDQLAKYGIVMPEG